MYGGMKIFFNDGDIIELKVVWWLKREVDDVVCF